MPTAILVNGEPREVAAANVAALLSELNIAGKKVAVEHNKEIVSRDKYDVTELQAGDAVEIVQFVGGG